jgi:ABC-type multidrug transport system fused ATPase/permease subunit
MTDNVPNDSVGTEAPPEKTGVMTNILHRIAEQLEAIREIQAANKKEITKQLDLLEEHEVKLQVFDEFKAMMQVTVSRLLVGLPAALILAAIALVVAIASVTSVMTLRSDMREVLEKAAVPTQ